MPSLEGTESETMETVVQVRKSLYVHTLPFPFIKLIFRMLLQLVSDLQAVFNNSLI